MTNEAAKASEIRNWLEEAVSDVAYSMTEAWMDDKWKKKLQRAKQQGVTDIHGWLADELYNDVDTLCDLTGDRIYDAAEGESYEEKKANMILIAEAIKETAHSALIKAMDCHIKRWKE